jgi:cyclophilin family peptidyl-prolyl cis-trans isomerase/HEAT repeat protein
MLAQSSPAAARLAVLQAEDRRAATAADLATLRSGARSADAQTVRAAVRALGRLERPELISDILPSLRHALPEVRIEAATAIGQAAQGWKRGTPPPAATVADALNTVVARLRLETDGDVRTALCETIGRLPYAAAADAERAERALLETAARAESVTGRLGVAKGFETLVRNQRKLRPLSADAIGALRLLALPANGEASSGARVRRLALEALISAAAIDDPLVEAASRDPDAQVRRLAMRAAGLQPDSEAAAKAVAAGLADDSPMVRLEALRSVRSRNSPNLCAVAHTWSSDRDLHVALTAIDLLAACGTSADAIATLEAALNSRDAMAAPRGWHRAAHALVSLAAAAKERADAPLREAAVSRVWQVRMYAARSAALCGTRDLLERLATDTDDNVREAAVEGLKKVAAHDADAIYIAQLTRPGYQVIRAAALALDGALQRDPAIAALKTAWERLFAEGRDNSHDARDAIAKTLTALGAPAPKNPERRSGAHLSASDFSPEELKRLASPRARVTIRDVGTFDLALFTAQAPASVLRFAHLAESGYYNGLTFHRVVPNFVIQGGSPGANEYIGDAMFMRDEVGSWPHVRGAVGISTRGRDTGDAQIFIDTVDNPRLDHDYTVFAQVLNGIEVVDRILEGDVIEKIEIVR